jgi:hypothetical protein
LSYGKTEKDLCRSMARLTVPRDALSRAGARSDSSLEQEPSSYSFILAWKRRIVPCRQNCLCAAQGV